MKKIVFMMLMLFVTSVLAQNETSEVSPKPQIISTAPTYEDSQTIRERKKFSVTGELGFNQFGAGSSGNDSSGISLIPVWGLELAGFLRPNTLLAIEHREYQGGGNTWGLNDGLYRTSATGINVKQFVGKTFYLKGGLEHREFAFEHRFLFQDLIGGGGNFTGTSTAASLGIGNQWQFNNFTIGVDWFTVSLPVEHRVVSEKINPSFIREDKYIHDQEDNLLAGTGILALNFYLGASF